MKNLIWLALLAIVALTGCSTTPNKGSNFSQTNPPSHADDLLTRHGV